MAGTLKEIAIGIMHGKLPRAAEHDLAKSRITECVSCQHFKAMTRQCGLCGCFMDIKAKILEAECPAGRW